MIAVRCIRLLGMLYKHLHRGAVHSQIPATWGISNGHFDVCIICEDAANHPTNGRAKIARKFAFTPPRIAHAIANVMLSAGIPVFVQRVLRRAELAQTHLEGLTFLARGEDWILGCLHQLQIRVPFEWSTPAPAA
jgi:hypothetical protein